MLPSFAWSLHQFNFFMGIEPHDSLLPGAPPVPAILAHLEGWWLWPLVSSRSGISKNVLFDGDYAIKQEHDVGKLVPHIPFGPNLKILKVIAGSSTKVVFGKSSVFVNDEPAGMHRWFMPLECCGDPVNIPIGQVVG